MGSVLSLGVVTDIGAPKVAGVRSRLNAEAHPCGPPRALPELPGTTSSSRAPAWGGDIDDRGRPVLDPPGSLPKRTGSYRAPGQSPGRSDQRRRRHLRHHPDGDRPYAEVLAEAGVSALLYDHLNLGISGGEPRQEINPWVQSRGYRDAVTLASTIEGHDPQ